MPAPAEVQAATLDEFIKGWEGWTPRGFLDTWSNSCTQKTLPFSANVPTRTKDHTEHLFPILMSLLTDFQLTVHNVVHDVANGKAAIYAFTKANTPVGPYQNEHALFLWFNEDGKKVEKIEEMFDGVFMKDFMPKLEKHIAEHEAKAQSQLA
ncbi:hypothetical protein INS49_012293 [Diaporthe citri]|uniref:uncharacterized protein n=1 Tax=Diaporthe citri TaxID=83186 RepID=UPI001C80E628|nr:uncharacterized protein INS49_012293 [Diaporthe citri]KAG6358774.1 hypothetical protein INS49_012293 [Diaporthe citri]